MYIVGQMSVSVKVKQLGAAIGGFVDTLGLTA